MTRLRVALVVRAALVVSTSGKAFTAKTITVTAEADLLVGTRGNDVIHGGAGTTRSAAFSEATSSMGIVETTRCVADRGPIASMEVPGNNVYLGGPGNDSLIASGHGFDKLTGGPGNDRLITGYEGAGGEGVVYLVGGSGNDVLQGSGSNDYFAGGAGNDRLLGVRLVVDAFLEQPGCGPGTDFIEVLGTFDASQAKTLRTLHSCERVRYRSG